MDPWFNVAANLNNSPAAASKDTHVRLVNTAVARYTLAAGFPAHSYTFLLRARRKATILLPMLQSNFPLSPDSSLLSEPPHPGQRHKRPDTM